MTTDFVEQIVFHDRIRMHQSLIDPTMNPKDMKILMTEKWPKQKTSTEKFIKTMKQASKLGLIDDSKKQELASAK